MSAATRARSAASALDDPDGFVAKTRFGIPVIAEIGTNRPSAVSARDVSVATAEVANAYAFD